VDRAANLEPVAMSLFTSMVGMGQGATAQFAHVPLAFLISDWATAAHGPKPKKSRRLFADGHPTYSSDTRVIPFKDRSTSAFSAMRN
jgi:hypothetical protein